MLIDKLKNKFLIIIVANKIQLRYCKKLITF